MRPVPGLSIEQQPTPILARMVLYGEARGEIDAARDLDAVGMLCVRHVIHNRAIKKDIPEANAMLERWAFSCLNDADPNREKLLTAYRDDRISWERADAVCDLFEDGLTSDPTGGATHYTTKAIWAADRPDWQERHIWYAQQALDAGVTKETYRRASHVFAVTP